MAGFGLCKIIFLTHKKFSTNQNLPSKKCPEVKEKESFGLYVFHSLYNIKLFYFVKFNFLKFIIAYNLLNSSTVNLACVKIFFKVPFFKSLL